MVNKWDGICHQIVTAQKHTVHGIMLPDNGPAEFENAEILWNSIEIFKKSTTAQLARTLEVGLQDEFSAEAYEIILRK